MKTIPSALLAHLGSEVTTLATCWKLTRRDGTVFGFTDHDQPIAVSGVIYAASTGFTPTAIASSSALNVDNLDVEGMLDAGAITETDLLAGIYDYAAIEIFEVNYIAPDSGTLPLKSGWLGEVTCHEGRFVAEVRGLTQRLSQRVGELYSPACRAALGDSRCKVDMTSRTVTGTLTAVTSQSIVKDSARTEESGRYNFGTLSFSSGPNRGISMEVRNFTSGVFTLVLPLPFLPVAGDLYRITEGCDKTFRTCSTRFGNAINFRGEPHVPGMDRMLETAATRSQF